MPVPFYGLPWTVFRIDLGDSGVACAMPSAGGIRSHSNAWNEYLIFKNVHPFLLRFSQFLPNCFPHSILYFVVYFVKKCCKLYDVTVPSNSK